MRDPLFPETPEGWNRLLLEKCGYGLPEFAYAPARIISDSDPRYAYELKDLPILLKEGRSAQYGEIRNELKRKRRLKLNLVKKLSVFPKLVGQIEKGEITEEEVEFITKVYGLLPFFQNIDKEINWLEQILEQKSVWRKKGRGTKTLYKIACVFSRILKKNGKPDWELIAGLLEWFHKLLANTAYAKELDVGDDMHSADRLRNESYKLFRYEKRRFDIERLAYAFFPASMARKPLRIEFKEDCILIEREDGKHPLISFPGGVFFNEDKALREASVALKRKQEQECKEEKPITIRLTKKDLAAFQKYTDLRERTTGN